MTQLAVDRLATPCQTALVRYRYTSGYTGNILFGKTYDLFLTIYGMAAFNGYTIKSVKLVSNNAVLPLSGVVATGLTANISNNTVVQTDPDGAGVGLEDLDGDGYFDDMNPWQSFDVLVEWEMQKPVACANDPAPQNLYIRGQFKNQCGQAIVSTAAYIIAGNVYPTGAMVMIASPGALVAGQTGTTEAYISRTAPNATYLGCTTNQFSVRFPVAPGMTVTAMRAGATNLSFTVVADTAIAILPGGTANPFVCDVDFTITPGVTPSGVRPTVILAYQCTSACPNSRQDVTCLQGPPIIIVVPGPCPNGGTGATNSIIKRTTTGFTTYAGTSKVPASSLPLTSLRRGLPCDSVAITSTGTMTAGLVITGGEAMFYEVSYDLHSTTNRLFKWFGGTYTYQGATTPLPAPQYEANYGGKHYVIYKLGNFPAGAVVNVNLKGIVLPATTLTNTLESVNGFGCAFFNLATGFSNPSPNGGDTRYLACGGENLEFYVRNPIGSFLTGTQYVNVGTGVCSIDPFFTRFYFLRGSDGAGLEFDYFPGEVRPMVKLDSIVVNLPASYHYVPGNDKWYVRGNISEGGFPANPNSTIVQTISPGVGTGQRIVFYNPGNWNVPDDASKGGFYIGFDFYSDCTAPLYTANAGGSVGIGTNFVRYYGHQDANSLDPNCPSTFDKIPPGWNTFSPKPTLSVTNLSGTQNADQRIECFDLKLNLLTTGSQNTYVYFPGGGLSNTFNIVSIKDVVTNVTYPILQAAGGQWVKLGDVAAGDHFYKLCTEYSNCANPDIPYMFSWGCSGYPANPAISGCSSVSGLFDLAPVPSGMQAQFVSQPVSPVSLCNPLVYDFSTTSTLGADLVDPTLEVNVPTGMSISTVQIEYPYNSGNFQTVTPPATTGIVTIPYGLHSGLVNASLPGVGFQPTVNPRTARMRLTFATDCNFTSGSRISVLAQGNEPCGQPAQGNNTLVYSDPITINGVSQDYIATVANFNIGADSIITCSNRTISTAMVLINTSAFPVTLNPALDSVSVSFPQGIQYVAGSYACTSSTCFLAPVVNPTTGNFALGVPAGIVIPGGGSITISFTYAINALLDEGCGVPGGMTISMVRSIAGITCSAQPGGVCPNPVKFIIGTATKNLVSQKAAIQNLTGLVCRTGTGQYSFNGTFAVNPGALPTGQTLLVELFCLNAGVPSGAPVATQVMNGPLSNTSGSISFSGVFTTTCSGENFRIRISPKTSAGVDQCACEEVVKDVALSNPTFTVSAGAACAGSVAISLPLNNITNGGNTYKIDFVDPAIPDITATTAIPVNGILVVPIPNSLAAGIYTGTVTVINSTISCQGTAPLTFEVYANPTATIAAPICLGGTGTIVGSGTKATVNPYVSANNTIATVTSTGLITGISVGTTTITYTNSLGCKVQKEVVVNDLPTVTLASATVCAGNSTTLTASGASTYSWNTGATTASISVSTDGVYSVTGTSAAGCANVANATLTTIASPTILVTSATICAGETATLTASGGATYVWSNGATTASISVSVAGTYSVTGISAQGCTATASGTLTVNPAVTASIGGSLSLCAGQTTTLTASGGTTYLWSTGATTAAISVSTAGPYSVTATSAAGCSNTATVTVNPLPTVTATSATICAGQSATLTASGGATYLWNTGATTASISVSVAGTYSVTGTTSAGCSATASGTLTVNPLPTVTATSATICAGETATLTAWGASSYVWSNGATTASISVAVAGTYSVTGISAQGCSATASGTLTVNPAVTASIGGSLSLCAGQTTTLTASGGTTYLWSTGATTAAISVSVAGPYSVTATSVAGCSNTATVTVTVNPLPTVTATSATICAGQSATLTASGASSYVWNTGATTSSISVAVAGTYSVTGISAQGCSATASGTLTVNPAVTASIGGSLSLCAGQTTTLTASGGTTYLWSTGATTAAISVSVAGPYSVTATSVAGCSNTATVTVTVNPLPTVTATSATICAGQSATLTASGAATYLWSNGNNTASIVVSATATTVYSVTGTSLAGCTAVSSGTVVVNGQPQIGSITQSTLCVGNTASLTVNATNTGAGILEYSLNGGVFQTTNVFTIDAPISTTATVVVRTQGSSCTATESVVVNCACATPVSLTFVPTALQTCAGSPVSFTAGVSGASSASLTSSGTGTFSQQIISGATTVSYTPSLADASAGSVTLTLSSADPDGVGACVADQVTRILTINPLPTVTATSATVCAGETATLIASGGATYLWNTGDITAAISVSVAGTYSVTGISAQGCTATASGTLTVNPAVTASIGGSLSLCAGQTTTLTASGGTTYLWSTGATTAAISVSTAGPYSVTATSAAGCSNTATATVTVNPLPTVIATSATICAGESATLTASGGATYLWSNGNNTASIVVSATATTVYSVTGTSLAGCTAVSSGTVVVNGQPQIGSITQSTLCVGNTASLTVNATNTGAGILEYSLNGGVFQTTNVFTIDAPISTTATVVVRTQGSSCTATESVVVNCACATPVSLTFVPTALQTCAGSPVSFTAGVSGASSASLTSSGTGTFSQQIISGATTVSYTPSLADASAGSVTLTLSSADPDGVGACVADQVTRILTINPAPTVTATSASICAGTEGSLMASGASTYVWSTGATTASISVSVAGTYSVTGISAQGCTATASGTLTIYATPTLNPASLPNGVLGVAYSQTLTTTGGTAAPYTFAVVGNLPTGLTLNPTTGVISGTPTAGTASFTVAVTDAKNCSAVAPLTIVISALPVCSLTATATPTTCNTANNQYSVSGTISATNTIASQSLTITDGTASTVVTLSNNGPVSYTLTGLNSDGLTHTVMVLSSATPCGMTSVTYTAPMACTVASLPTYVIAKTVDLKQVEKGQTVTYTLSVTNTSAVEVTNLALTDQFNTTAFTPVGSATASAGSFVPGINGGVWSLNSLAAGQEATLSYTVQLNAEGITYNTVTAPNGQTVTVCTTVPFRVCANEPFEFELSLPNSFTAYQWSFNGQPIAGATTNTVSATALGEYTVTINGLGSCPTGSCCPFIVGSVGPLPSLTAVTVAASCSTATPQADAQITLVGSNTVAVSYNITIGSSFTATTPLFTSPRALSSVVATLLLGGQPSPAIAQDYTIRVYSATGCFTDTVVTILPTLCNCPPPVCVPFVVKKTRAQGKPL